MSLALVIKEVCLAELHQQGGADAVVVVDLVSISSYNGPFPITEACAVDELLGSGNLR